MQLRCQQERTPCQNLCVETMKTPTLCKAKWTVRGYEEANSDEGCFEATATTEGVPMVLAWCIDMRDKGHEASVGGYTQAFLISAVPRRPPARWGPKTSSGWAAALCVEGAESTARLADVTAMLAETLLGKDERTML